VAVIGRMLSHHRIVERFVATSDPARRHGAGLSLRSFS
jgi:hypothetical protein